MNGYDVVFEHRGTLDGVISALFEVVESDDAPGLDVVREVARRLWTAAQAHKRELGAATVFQATVFRRMVATATALAEAAGSAKR